MARWTLLNVTTWGVEFAFDRPAVVTWPLIGTPIVGLVAVSDPWYLGYVVSN